MLLVTASLDLPLIPIDGKTLRGSYDREQKKSALHLVSAWASEHRLVLGQVKVADKSNEIKRSVAGQSTLSGEPPWQFPPYYTNFL